MRSITCIISQKLIPLLTTATEISLQVVNIDMCLSWCTTSRIWPILLLNWATFRNFLRMWSRQLSGKPVQRFHPYFSCVASNTELKVYIRTFDTKAWWGKSVDGVITHPKWIGFVFKCCYPPFTLYLPGLVSGAYPCMFVGYQRRVRFFFQVDNASTPFSKSNPSQSLANQKILFWLRRFARKQFYVLLKSIDRHFKEIIYMKRIPSPGYKIQRCNPI